MPPHDDHEGDGAAAFAAEHGLPVRRRLLKPGAVVTGAVLAAAFALAAHVRALSAGLVWDDRVFLLDDPRVRTLASVGRSFGQPFFTADHPTEMYRPLVNASLAVDWFLSGSAPGAPNVVWFHAVNLLLHAVNAALVYVLFVQLTRRKLGAPLIAAVLFAVHPLAVEPATWIVGRCDLLAAACGLGSAILLVRAPGKPRLLAASVALWGIGLFAKASLATLPAIVAAALVAYHGVEPRRLLTRRFLARFAWFALPAAVWVAARLAVFADWPFPDDAGRAWPASMGLVDRLQGVGRAVWVQTAHVFLPVRLSGDYAGDLAAWAPHTRPWDVSSVAGLGVLAVAVVAGALRLRRGAAGFPLLAYALALVPVLQIVPIGAIYADRFQYLPMAFLLLLVAEGLEGLYYRWGAARGLSVTLVVFAAFVAQSHARSAVWRDGVAFQRDVLAQFPESEDARYRLTLARAESGDRAERDAAKRELRERIDLAEKPDDELALLGQLLLEDGELAEAEAVLRRAFATTTKRRLGARTAYNLGVCLKAQGRREEAVLAVEAALRLDPDLAPARALLAALRGG